MKDTIEEQNLMSCPTCGHSCSIEAQSCPNCGKPFPAPSNGSKKELENTVYTHILTHASGHIGMCLTLLGLVRVVEGVKNVHTLADEFLAISAVGFLVSSLLTYSALKKEEGTGKQKLGRAGDFIFTGSLGLLGVICVSLVFEFL
jgi:hypothetical protein